MEEAAARVKGREMELAGKRPMPLEAMMAPAFALVAGAAFLDEARWEREAQLDFDELDAQGGDASQYRLDEGQGSRVPGEASGQGMHEMAELNAISQILDGAEQSREKLDLEPSAYLSLSNAPEAAHEYDNKTDLYESLDKTDKWRHGEDITHVELNDGEFCCNYETNQETDYVANYLIEHSTATHCSVNNLGKEETFSDVTIAQNGAFPDFFFARNGHNGGGIYE